ncbi:MAG: hypothetical protein P1U64_11075 [Alcanivoracaceae bacterium]|nr:hypothetical protein [Alcanivoracaceae bacterium]
MYSVSDNNNKSFIAGLFLLLAGLVTGSAAHAMEELSDDQLSDVIGQALFVSNSQSQGGFDFTSVALDVEMEINTNISQLQLGCGGINGPGICDIDIDDFSLTGDPAGACGPDRVNCSAILTRPFIEFAIKNNGSRTLREVVGFRLSAENMQGLVTAGQNTSSPNGINRLSGYVEVAPTSGTATTQPGVFGTQPDEQINTLADLNIAACTSGCGSGRPLYSLPGSSAGLNIPSVSAPFTIPAFTIYGNRLESVSVNASAAIPNITLTQPSAGTLAMELATPACVLYLVCISETELRPDAVVAGLSADITFDEDLGFIHKLPINNPFSLSFQKENLQWPGATETSLRGWWMSFQDPVDFGELNPAEQVDISSAYPQLAVLMGTTLAQPANRVTVTTGDGLESLFSGGISKDLGTLNLTGQTVFLNLSDLALDSSQDVVSNCRGGGSTCFF